MKFHNKSLLNSLFSLFIVTLVPPVSAAPITFNTALPVAKGEFVNREQVVLVRSGNDPGSQGRDMMVNSLVSVLGYGVSGKLAAFVALPYADKKLSVFEAERSNDDFGDLTTFARYTFWQQNALGQTFRIAGFGGVKAPTGSDNKSDSLGRLPTAVQPGTGVWDGFGGVVATYQTLEYQLDGQLAYRVNNLVNQSANSFDAGDEARLDASLQYRLWPRTLRAGLPGFLYGVLETNLIYRGHNDIQGQGDPDSGGTTLFLTPGLQYVTKRVILEAAIQLPVLQDLNGTALETDYMLRTGFRWNF